MEEEIISSLMDRVRIIKLNRPDKKNAINLRMYTMIINILNADADNDDIVLTIITGVGDYYSSGVDLKMKQPSSKSKQFRSESVYSKFINAFIKYPKIIVAVVNGPAMGLAVTTLGLCDVVYASDRATFSTPFLKIGMPPEGCSTYTFPRTMGRSKTMEMLVLGKTLSADEAVKANFVSKVIPHALLQDKIVELLEYGKLEVNSIKKCKKLITSNLTTTLLDVNMNETEEVMKSYRSGALAQFAKRLIKKKSKL